MAFKDRKETPVTFCYLFSKKEGGMRDALKLNCCFIVGAFAAKMVAEIEAFSALFMSSSLFDLIS